MNARERVLTVLNHRQADRVALDFSGHRSSGIMVQAYKKLREYLGLPRGTLYVYDMIQQLAVVEDDVLDLLGVDVVPLGYNYYKKSGYWKDWELEDGTPCKIPAFIDVNRTNEGNVVYGDSGQVICAQRKGCLYFEQTYFPLADKVDTESFNDLANSLNQVMWNRLGVPPSPAGYAEFGRNAREIRQDTDRAIYGTFGGNLFETGQFAFRMDNFLYMLAAYPETVHRFLDRLMEIHMGNLEKYLHAVGDSIDIIGFGDDLGMQTGPLLSPAMYRAFFKDRHKTMWSYVKKHYPHLKISLHSCGGIFPLLGDLIEAGLDAVNPVQISCKGIDPSVLKREFGKDLVFWGGGCDTRNVLPFGTPEQIRKHVKENIEIFERDGGFVFQQVHNIMANVPPENVVAMFESIRGT